jgi:hypothetical protein
MKMKAIFILTDPFHLPAIPLSKRKAASMFTAQDALGPRKG